MQTQTQHSAGSCNLPARPVTQLPHLSGPRCYAGLRITYMRYEPYLALVVYVLRASMMTASSRFGEARTLICSQTNSSFSLRSGKAEERAKPVSQTERPRGIRRHGSLTETGKEHAFFNAGTHSDRLVQLICKVKEGQCLL